MHRRRDERVDTLTEQFRAGEISRRHFIGGLLGLGLSVGSAGSLLAACSSSKGSSSASAASTTSATTGVKAVQGHVQILVGFGTGNTPAQIPVQQALADAFTKLHPGVTIDFLRIPSSNDAKTKLTVLIAGGTPPDLIMPMGLYGTSLFVDQNVFLDLGDLIKRDGLALDGFVPVTADAIRVPNYYGTSSTAAIGLPVGVHVHALAYNAGLLQKAGVTPPPSSWDDATWTYDKFAQLASMLTVDGKGRRPGDAGFDAKSVKQFGAGHFFRETIFLGYGGKYYDPATKQAQLGTDASIKGIQFAADLVNKMHVQPSMTQTAALGAGGGQGNEEQFLWRAGQLAMIDMCSCDIKSPFGTDVPFDFGAAAIPAGPARRFTFLNLDVGAITQASKNRDAAWEVLKFFAVDPANERKLSFDSYGAFPPLKINNDAFVQGIKSSLPKTDPAVWQAGFPSASPDNEAWFPAFSEVNTLVGKTFDSIVDGAAADQAMPKLQTDAQAKIDEWFTTHKLP